MRHLYAEVVVTSEVAAELIAGGMHRPGVAEFIQAQGWLKPLASPRAIAPYLLNALDRGEASVIQAALDQHIPLVAIDEVVGRRAARLAGLSVTGCMADSFTKLRAQDIWQNAQVQSFALQKEARL